MRIRDDGDLDQLHLALRCDGYHTYLVYGTARGLGFDIGNRLCIVASIVERQVPIIPFLVLGIRAFFVLT